MSLELVSGFSIVLIIVVVFVVIVVVLFLLPFWVIVSCCFCFGLVVD